MTQGNFEGLSCPVPRTESDRVLLGHGSGGTLTAELVRRLFVPGYGNDILAALEDQAVVELDGYVDRAETAAVVGQTGGPATGDRSPRNSLRVAFTTDSFVVQPLFFPGGDIGRLAICGTVNDLAVGGAAAMYLSAAFILEEGMAMSDVARIVNSMRHACDEAQVQLVTGDTKVVERGKGDQVFITTSGIGLVPAGRNLSVRNARPGDRVLVSGTMGDHGITILSVREGLEFETALHSDAAPLGDLTQTMLDSCPHIRWMRDPTRGGLSSALNELATASSVGVRIAESSIPVRDEVRAACELLGLDPLYVANEGKLLAVVPPVDAERLLEAMRRHPLGRDAAIIGEIVDDHPGMVVQKSVVGGQRVVTMLAGEQLPRIC